MSFSFLSFGGGVQTTALLLTGSYDEVIFADTQGEHPETYSYLEEHVLPYVLDKAIKFTVLDDPVSDSKQLTPTRSLEEFCLARKMTPSRQNRWCTERFKIKRIARYVKATGRTPAIAVMGISWDEVNRIHDSHSRAYTFEYPLVDAKLTRDDCKRIIQEHGWPVPPKSGCFYCPFQRVSGWHELYVKHPDLFKKAREMEENQQHYPKFVLSGTGKSLKKLAVRFGEGSAKLDLFVEEETCEAGYCMV